MIIIRLFFAVLRIPIILITFFIAPIDWQLARDIEKLFGTNFGFWELSQPGYWDTHTPNQCTRIATLPQNQSPQAGKESGNSGQ